MSCLKSYVYHLPLLAFLGAFAKLRKATISFVMSVRLSVLPSGRPHGTTRLTQDRFSWNLMIF